MTNPLMPGNNIITIDAHQHFWKYDKVRDSWIDENMKVIQRDFLPADLQPILAHNHIAGSVVVQSSQSNKENIFQLNNANKNDFIKGVVGWVHLMADGVEEQLAALSRHKKLKGFRHVLQGEPQRNMMLLPAFKNGISHLAKYGFTFDLLILPDQLPYALQLVREFPYQPFVIDHLAKPPIKNGEISTWKKAMEPFSSCTNVCCKISGMVTEADWNHWRWADLKPYIDVVVQVFGTDRIMFGSDWPVCLLAAPFDELIGGVRQYFQSFSAHEKAAVFGINAQRFYRL